MKISIIIPTYNSGKTLRSCLDSIITQTYQDWEVLLMDAVSKDNTLTIAKDYGDARISVFSEPDKGIYDAMNKGIDKATGDWLYFLGSDDSLFETTTLEKVVSYMQLDVDVVYGEVNSTAWEELFGEWSYSTLRSNRCHQAIFYNKRFFADGHRYDLRYRVWADYDLNLRWFLMPQYKSLYMPIIVANYNACGFSSNREDEMLSKDFGKKVLQYGYKTLPSHLKKEYARDYIQRNPEKKIICGVLKLYVLSIRLISK